MNKQTEALADQPAQHPDDVAVDLFAEAMKAKMAKQRAKGYGGWNDPVACPTERLQQMLVGHITKGDPVDVANFAMMLWSRGERTEQPAQQQKPVGEIGKIVMFGGDLKEVSWKNGKMPPVGSILYTSPPARRKPLTMQPIIKDQHGVIRFKANAIVEHLLETHKAVDMNKLHCMDFTDEDRQQFAQLIGYSLGGYADLSYVTDEAYETAEQVSHGIKGDA